jgi:parvulin-like peptidyl-prolyl isomerase
LNLAMARLSDQAKADQVRSIVLRPGVDFVTVASANSVSSTAPGAPTAGAVGWRLPEQLDQPVQDALKNAKAGDVSAVIKNGDYDEVWKVVESSDSRDLGDDQRDTIAQKRVDAWVADQRKDLKIARDLSSGEDTWIRTHAIADYQKATANTSG